MFSSYLVSETILYRDVPVPRGMEKMESAEKSPILDKQSSSNANGEISSDRSMV